MSIDQLGKKAYEKPDLLYKYNGVDIPPLGMVDDILTVTNVENTGKMNKMVTTFIESKNRRLSKSKCFRIYIGKGHENCPELKVCEDTMKDVKQEKYLGDVIDESGTIQDTIERRRAKGEGNISEILYIIEEIPLGKHKTEVALKLRDAMLINGIIYNSEAWHGITNAQIAKLESVDEALLGGIWKAHIKKPKEFLHLDTGTVSLKWISVQGRLNYLKYIISRDNNELLKKVFLAQKASTTSGDFNQISREGPNRVGN